MANKRPKCNPGNGKANKQNSDSDKRNIDVTKKLKHKLAVFTDDKKLMQEFKLTKKPKVLSRTKFRTLSKNKNLTIGIMLNSIIPNTDGPITYKITRINFWDKLRNLFIKHGLTTGITWKLTYKKGKYELSLGAGHWKDLIKAVFKIVTFTPMEGFNFHLFSIHHWGPDYFCDFSSYSICILNFDITLYKTWD